MICFLYVWVKHYDLRDFSRSFRMIIYPGKTRKADVSTSERKSSKKREYQCDEYEFTTDNSRYLLQHGESKHKGIKYPCNQCKYAATQLGSLKRHIKYKHEGVRYSCDQCEYAATTSSHLKRHKFSKH